VHVVVLAAGRGSRLGPQGDALPKWLLEVGGRTLAARHLAGIAAARRAGDVAGVAVVVGHAGAAVEEDLARRSDAVRVVRNPEYAERNNWWSLLRALRELPEEGPVVVLNADLLVAPAHLAAFIGDAARGEADGLLCVDTARRLTDESMKVALDAGGALAAIGKTGIADAAGEYIGILMARAGVLRALRARLEEFDGRPEARDEWYEGAVGRSVGDGARWQIWPMPDGGWIEIDDHADLAAADDLAREVDALP
ncbi:MAG TPA: NTP transferase domain-containing protein, partial [Miltoncostaeaceae bacterium]|nr:NTP transferase domain-containing protein [Miltoncostaeaceae bacterium]